MKAKPKPEPREIKSMEFEYTIRAQGHSGRIGVPLALVGKRARIKIDVID